jgi:uncharacterized membrane protein/protein-disulfide isomerase
MSVTQKLLAVLITALALVALGVSSYLTWVAWQQSTVAGCTGGALVDCDEVLSSSASKWLGIPVSMLGAALYTGILAVVWPATMRGGWLMTALLTLAMMAAGAGVWFVGNQAFVVQHFCLYCMAVHSCGLVICVLAVLLTRATAGAGEVNPMQSYFAADDARLYDDTPTNPLMPVIAAGIASVGLMALIGGQIFFAPSGMEVVDIPIPEQSEAADVEGSGRLRSTEEEPEGQAPRLAEEVEEPAGEVVLATDEDETEPAEEEITGEEQGLDIATETSNQSFEELFGESPGDTLLTATSNSPVPRVFRFKYLKGDIDVENNPVLGNPYARARMVEMLDYTCPHCRKMHQFIKKSVDRYGDQFGVVIYHVPLSRKCNQLVKIDQTSHANACDIAKLAFGVWKLAPKKFPEFHDWLMTGDKAPPLHEVKTKAMALAGSKVLTDKSIEVAAKRRVAEHAADMEALKVGLPILVFENGVIKGMPGSDQEWFQMLEQRLGVKPAAATAQN